MGGDDSEVTDETTEVLLEAANFEPIGILRTSERLALRTAGLEPLGEGRRPVPRRARGRAREPPARRSAGARMTGHADVHDGLPERPVVRLRPERASRLIGLDVPPDEQRATLAASGSRSPTAGTSPSHVAGARRHARGRRHRGGRAAASRPYSAHDAAAAPRPRTADEGSTSPASSSRTRSSARASRRRTRGALSPPIRVRMRSGCPIR